MRPLRATLVVLAVLLAATTTWGMAFPGSRIEMPADSSAFRSAQEPEIVIYTTSWCGYCAKMVKELEGLGVDFSNRDIERDKSARDALVRLVGSTGVPVTVVDGQVIRGYNPALLRKLVTSAR